MASRKLLKDLVALNKIHNKAFEWWADNATDTSLQAHITGAKLLIAGLSQSQRAGLTELEKAIAKLKALKMPVSELEIQKGKLENANMALALAAVDDKRKSGTVIMDRDLPENSMLGCEFRSAMALYRFCSVNAETWEVWSLNVPTRRGSLVIASVEVAKSLIGKGEDGTNILTKVTSPTRARQICMLCHKPFSDGMAPGLTSIVTAFTKAEFPNGGGIGSTKDFPFLFGKYAKLFAQQATPWLAHMRKHGVLPSNETLKKRK